MSTPQQIEEKNIKIVRRSIEALNTGDVTNVSEFIHPNYFDRDSQSIPGREKLRGSEAFVNTVKKLRAALSELHYKEQEITTANDKIAEHKAFRDDLSFMIQLGVIGPASPQYEPIINAWKGMMNKPT